MGVPGKDLPNQNSRRGHRHHRWGTPPGSLREREKPYLACLEPERVVRKAPEKIELRQTHDATKCSSRPPRLRHGTTGTTYVRLNLVLSDAFVDEVHDVLCGSAGEEDFGDAGLLQGRDVGFGDDAADEDGDVVHAFVVEEFHELWADGVVRAGKDGEADDVDVFLDSGRGDHFGSLAQAGVNDFHAGVAEGAGDYFCAAVVAVQPRLGDQHSDFFLWHGLGDGDFFVGAEDVAEGVADFAEGGVGFDGVVEEGHEVVFALGGGAEGVEAAIDFCLGAVGAEFFQAGGLAVGDGLVNLKHVKRLLFGNEIIDADDDFFFLVYGQLVTVRGFGDFALRIAALDGGDHAAHGVDAIDVFPGTALDFVGQSLDEVGAAERVDSIGDASFVGDDLLGAQGDGSGEFRGESPSFIE